MAHENTATDTSSPNAAGRHARLSVRLPEEQKALIDEAAARSGLTTTAFVVATLVDRARRVLLEHAIAVLSKQDRERFLAILDNDAVQSKPPGE